MIRGSSTHGIRTPIHGRRRSAINRSRAESSTNAAVVDAVLSRGPRTVLDLGCGEGWLTRALDARGIDVLGVDVVPELVTRAAAAGGGRFQVASYEDIGRGALDVRVDLAVANFSLIGKEPVDALLASLPRLLTAGGSLVIQTLHPVVAAGEQGYVDGWREGSWAGFSNAFANPAPWYFRRIETWVRLLVESGFRIADILEPMHPISNTPASIVFVGETPG